MTQPKWVYNLVTLYDPEWDFEPYYVQDFSDVSNHIGGKITVTYVQDPYYIFTKSDNDYYIQTLGSTFGFPEDHADTVLDVGHFHRTLVPNLKDWHDRKDIFGTCAFRVFVKSIQNITFETKNSYIIANMDNYICPWKDVYILSHDYDDIYFDTQYCYNKNIGDGRGVSGVAPFQGYCLNQVKSCVPNNIDQYAAWSLNYTVFDNFQDVWSVEDWNAIREKTGLIRIGIGIYPDNESYSLCDGNDNSPMIMTDSGPVWFCLLKKEENVKWYANIRRRIEQTILKKRTNFVYLDYETGECSFENATHIMAVMFLLGDWFIPYLKINYEYELEDGTIQVIDRAQYVNRAYPDFPTGAYTRDEYISMMIEQTNLSIITLEVLKAICDFALSSADENLTGRNLIQTRINGSNIDVYRFESWNKKELYDFAEFALRFYNVEKRIATHLKTYIDQYKAMFTQRLDETVDHWIKRITGGRLNGDGTSVIQDTLQTAINGIKTAYDGHVSVSADDFEIRHQYWSTLSAQVNTCYNSFRSVNTDDYVNVLYLFQWRAEQFITPWYANEMRTADAYLTSMRDERYSYTLDNSVTTLNFNEVYLYYDGLNQQVFGPKIICLPMVQVKQVIDACYQTSSNMNKKVLCFLRNDIAYLKRVYSEWFGSTNVLDGETCIKSEFNINAILYFRKWQTILAINFAYADYMAGKTLSNVLVEEDQLYKLYDICKDTTDVNYRNFCNYYLFTPNNCSWYFRADGLGHAVCLYLRPIDNTVSYPDKTATAKINSSDTYTINSDDTITMNNRRYKKLIAFSNVNNTSLDDNDRRTIIPLFSMNWKNNTPNPSSPSHFKAPEELTADSWANEMYRITANMLDYVTNGFLKEISEYCATENPGGWQCQGYEAFNQNDIIKYIDCCKEFALNITEILNYYEEHEVVIKNLIKPVRNEPEESYETRLVLDYNRLKINGVRIDEILLDACDGIYTQGTFYHNADTVEERTALWASIAKALQVYVDTAVLNDPRTPEGLIYDIREYIPESTVISTILYRVSPLLLCICKKWCWEPYTQSGYIGSNGITYMISNN